MDGINLLSEGRLDQAGENRVDGGSPLRTIAEAYFSEDDTWAQGAFCVVIGWVNIGKLHKSQPILTLFHEAFSKRFRILKVQGLGTNLFKFGRPMFHSSFYFFGGSREFEFFGCG